VSTPPFKLASVFAPASQAVADAFAHGADDACPACERTVPGGRTRLGQLDAPLHCSVIGTCLGTGELRRLMSRFIDVEEASDLDVHHDAVKHSASGGPVAKALHKALDQRHGAVLQRFAKARGAEALAALWAQALGQGEIPGAYWAALTHRDINPALRQKIFGDVHMLSHLVGAANRADIRRLVELERENGALRERLERQQERSQSLLEERDGTIATLQSALASATAERDRADRGRPQDGPPAQDASSVAALVALQTERRERAEQASAAAGTETARLLDELEHSRLHALALGRELTALEAQLQEEGGEGRTEGADLERKLRGKRILYVGGRPSSSAVIRDLVGRRGGDFQRHDGGLEDRKGLLPAAVAWAELVVFPVDCVDHDSVNHLKRLCARQGVAYLPLRSASVASFAAGLAAALEDDTGDALPAKPICLKHG
jgi:hypothetical protein